MLQALFITAVIVGMIGFGLYGAYLWWGIVNSPDGERWAKRRMQGPFVPLSAAEIEKDQADKTPKL